MTSDSESFFQRTLEQKTIEARQAVDTCLKAYLSPSDKNRQSAAVEAFNAVDRLFQLLHETDRPAWLKWLRQDLTFAHQNSNDSNGVIAVQRIASDHYPDLLAHQWRVGSADSSSGFDFDAVFEKYRSYSTQSAVQRLGSISLDVVSKLGFGSLLVAEFARIPKFTGHPSELLRVQLRFETSPGLLSIDGATTERVMETGSPNQCPGRARARCRCRRWTDA